MRVPVRNSSTRGGATRNFTFDNNQTKKDAMTESIDQVMRRRGENIMGQSASRYDTV